MEMTTLGLDGRRLETRAHELIVRVGLADEYGEKGGLIATYDQEIHALIIEDEAVRSIWAATDGHFFSEAQWKEMHCFITSCTDHGYAEEHAHFEMKKEDPID